MKKTIQGALVFVLGALALCALFSQVHDRSTPRVLPEASAQNSDNGNDWRDNRYFLTSFGTFTSLAVIDTANYTYTGTVPGALTYGTNTTQYPSGMNHTIVGGWVGGTTAGAYHFFNISTGTTGSAASEVFTVNLAANTTMQLPPAIVQKGLSFGLGNPISVIGPGVCNFGLWIRDDPK